MNKYLSVISLMTVAGFSHADLRSEITAARKKQEKATMAKDIKGAEAALRESMTSDFKYVQQGKTQDAKTFIANSLESFTMMDKIASSSSRIISLKQSGNRATGTIELSMTGTMKGTDKKPHAMNWTGLFTEEYRKVGGKWKTASMTAGKQNFLVDGKAVKM